jgi:hypothetical protein
MQERDNLKQTSKGFAGFFQRQPQHIPSLAPVWSELPTFTRLDAKLPDYQTLANCPYLIHFDENHISYSYQDRTLAFQRALPTSEGQPKSILLIDLDHVALFFEATVSVFRFSEEAWSLLYSGKYCTPYSINSEGIVYWSDSTKTLVRTSFNDQKSENTVLDLEKIVSITPVGYQDFLMVQKKFEPRRGQYKFSLIHYSDVTKISSVLLEENDPITCVQQDICLIAANETVYSWDIQKGLAKMDMMSAQEVIFIDNNYLVLTTESCRFWKDMYDGSNCSYNTDGRIFSLVEKRVVSRFQTTSDNTPPVIRASSNGTIIVESAFTCDMSGNDSKSRSCYTWPTKYALARRDEKLKVLDVEPGTPNPF